MNAKESSSRRRTTASSDRPLSVVVSIYMHARMNANAEKEKQQEIHPQISPFDRLMALSEVEGQISQIVFSDSAS